MQVEYQLAEDDLRAFADYQVRFSPHVQARIRRYRTGYLVGFLLLALGFWMSERQSFLAILLGVFAALLYLLAPTIYRFRLRSHLVRSFHDPADRLKYRKHRLRITDDGLVDESDEATSTVKWSAIVKVDQTPLHGYIYLATNSAIIVPREPIGDDLFQSFMTRAMELWKNVAA